MYDFLLVAIVTIAATYLTLNNIVTLKSGLEVTVIETGAIQKLGCGFLFAFHSNYGAILCGLRDIERLLVEYRENFIPNL